MGIGHQALAVFEEILDKNLLFKSKSVMEMGSQDIPGHYQERAKDIIRDDKIKNKSLISAKDFYLGIGFKEYCSIDADGKHDSFIFDLNKNLKKDYRFEKEFDLVTNFGTSEHVFNQKNFFENIHSTTKKDGLMFHILPFEGYINHGYFNYHPSYFYDLALFNRYEILGFWYFSERPLKNFTHYYGYSYGLLNYNDDLIKYLDKLAEEKILPGTPSTNHSSLGVLYKKKSDMEFRDPFQFDWMKSNKLKEYNFDDTKIDHIYNFNKNVDHKKQIDDALSGGYWKVKIKKLLLDNKYRIKVLKILLRFFGIKVNSDYRNKYWRD